MANKANPKVRKAETAAGSPAKKVKVSVKDERSDSKKPTADEATASNLPNADDMATNAPFAWQTVAGERDDFKRLEVKEEAFRQGLRYADRIRSILEPVVDSSASILDEESGGTELRNWQIDLGTHYSSRYVIDILLVFTDVSLDNLKKTNSEFRVFVGFAGVTGAGKTSAINSIIDFRDLLPSSNEAAATSVPCLIAYNEDTNPDAAFRAEVVFKTEYDMRQELDRYFDALGILDEVSNSLRSEDHEHNDERNTAPDPARDTERLERLKDLDIVGEDNQDLFDMVSAVFGVDQDALRSESTDNLLANHPDVRNLLGRTLHIVGSNEEEFSEKIRPYMDSVPAVHGTSGVEFAAWPLINEVKVFVRSNVLKNGVVLVDLPGLADNVESRASVAQNYFSKLSVTAVVAPIIRARNEQTAVNLMTENQQYQMQMDGKFHKKSFCVILSKMDDINVATYLTQHSTEAKRDQALQTWRDSLKALDREFNEIKSEMSAHKQLLKQLNRQDRNDLDEEGKSSLKVSGSANVR